jgi:hypothetical protein
VVVGKAANHLKVDPMLKLVAACAAGVVCLAGCASTIGLPSSSPSRTAGAGTPAAAVRARMVQLMGEHTYVVAKLTVAATVGRKDEYTSYAGLLAASEDDVAVIVAKAAGESQGSSFAKAWLLGDSFFVDYMVATTTRQQGLADAAMANLNTRYVPQMAQAISSPLNISMSSASRLLADQVTSTKQFMDDAAAGSPTAFYADVRAAYAKSTAMGGALAEGIAWKFPDKYPGDPSAGGAKVRAQLDSTMQEHAFLLSMATDAAAAGLTNELGPAAAALMANAQDMSQAVASVFGSSAGARAGQLWSDEDKSFIAYASAGDDAARTAALSALNQTSTPAIASYLEGLHVSADVPSVTQQTIGVIDDQRAKSYSVIAAEDRQSAALLVSIGDLMTGVRGG